MPPVNLTPDQQAKLDAFEASSAQAVTSGEAAAANAAAALTADALATSSAQDALAKHATALADGQAFIDAMLGRAPAPASPASPVAKR